MMYPREGDRMELKTISQVTRAYSVSTRTLRYYEKIGLLESVKLEGYAYRAYDDAAITKLGQIMLLRKLRISLRDIGVILASRDAAAVVEILTRYSAELSGEISALSTIRDTLERLAERLRMAPVPELGLLGDASLREIAASLPLVTIGQKEERSMDELNRADASLNRLTSRDVRIITLPPFTVASYHFIGANPEETVGGVMGKWLTEADLYTKKPDARMFGFNHPNPSPDREGHGYEDWVTIPDDMEVPAPLVKKRFPGGLYAVHSIVFGDFHEWAWLSEWAENSKTYAPNYAPEGPEIMSGLLEEHLNWVYHNHLGWPDEGEAEEKFAGLDLYLPIKHR
jgi:DNA-binding transcriptional MerR regulator/DNA gyrase inhibitor GyrI